MTLSEALPELVADVVGALVREGRGDVADQLPDAVLRAWSFDEFAQATYLHLGSATDPGAVEETISFYDDIGVNVDLDRQNNVLRLEVFGYEQSLARLPAGKPGK
jgi:hypothetical protein